MKKIIRVTTVPESMKTLLKGQLKYMSEYFNIVGVASDGDDLELVNKNEGIEVHALKMTRKITPIKDLLSIIKLVQFLRKEKPDAVHSHTPKAGLVAMLAAKICGINHRIHTVAGLPLMEASGIKRQVLLLVEKIIYLCASDVLPNSYNLKDFILEKKLCRPKKVEVIANGSSNGIDCDHFRRENIDLRTMSSLRDKYCLDSNNIIFLFIGRIVKDKGIVEIINAFEKLISVNKNVRLLLVGKFESDLDPIPDSILSKIENIDEIINCGFQRDVRPFLSISNIFVFPSYREGFPNVVMQAGAMELPSIVSNINGCNEIIIDNVNGKIVPKKDPEALYEMMRYFLENSNDVKRMALNAREMIVNRYEQKMVWKALLDKYNVLLN
ncbi:glycosyltransferase family 4 protein [Marinifilum flexuosum]|uniref:glycosyltransferase family 4 protein n=1 Tax=Marinifilum flexuosum TaxID=1117708 RepID=UPI00249419AE|nr:glycosyltransferase family 4 protein [Marinifilum flexuosum]